MIQKLYEKIKVYIRLIRCEDYATFLQLIIGFLLAKDFIVSFEDIKLLVKALFVLVPLSEESFPIVVKSSVLRFINL